MSGRRQLCYEGHCTRRREARAWICARLPSSSREWMGRTSARTSRLIAHSKLGSVPFILDAQRRPGSRFWWFAFQTRADLVEAQAARADAIGEPGRVGDFIPRIDVERTGVADSGDPLCGAQMAHPGVVDNRVQLRYTLLPRIRDMTIIVVHHQWRMQTQH